MRLLGVTLAAAIALLGGSFALDRDEARSAWTNAACAPAEPEAAFARIEAAGLALLGERHGDPAIHLWQRDTAERLRTQGRAVALGVEWLPTSAQPALDDYLARRIDEPTFLARVRWSETWGYDFAAYRPVFAWAREHGAPMRALNVEIDFIRRVSRQGFAAAAAEGAPISTPAPAAPAYRQSLAETFAAHGRAPDPAALDRFVEAQLVWDRAFAEGLSRLKAERPQAIVLGLMGAGHVAHGWGAAHQLRALGQGEVVTLVAAEECAGGLADFVYSPGR